MHVSPAKHSYAWLPRKCDYRTVRQTPDKVIPMCRYASQATQRCIVLIYRSDFFKVECEGLIEPLKQAKLSFIHWSVCVSLSSPCVSSPYGKHHTVLVCTCSVTCNKYSDKIVFLLYISYKILFFQSNAVLSVLLRFSWIKQETSQNYLEIHCILAHIFR